MRYATEGKVARPPGLQPGLNLVRSEGDYALPMGA